MSPITPKVCDRGRQKEADAKGEANVVRPFALRRPENLDRVRHRSHVADVVEKAREYAERQELLPRGDERRSEGDEPAGESRKYKR